LPMPSSVASIGWPVINQIRFGSRIAIPPLFISIGFIAIGFRVCGSWAGSDRSAASRPKRSARSASGRCSAPSSARGSSTWWATTPSSARSWRCCRSTTAASRCWEGSPAPSSSTCRACVGVGIASSRSPTSWRPPLPSGSRSGASATSSSATTWERRRRGGSRGPITAAPSRHHGCARTASVR
jgi:hypothetical protein